MSHEFYQLEDTTSSIYKFSVEFFDNNKLAYISVDESAREVRQITDQREKSYRELRGTPYCETQVAGREKRWGFCILSSEFNHQVTKHGLNPQWIIDIKSKSNDIDFYSAVTPHNLNIYLSGNYRTSKEAYLDKMALHQDTLETLKKGAFSLIVCQKDGIWFDADGKAIMRSFHFDQIYTPFKEDSYKFDGLIETLRANKNISNLIVEKIPHYNQSCRNERAIIFNYVPDDAEAFELLQNEDSISRSKFVESQLRVEHFKRKVRKSHDKAND